MARIHSLDLARGFTVLFIAPIHAVMLFSKVEVYQSWFGKALTFIAEGPGAQLFMLLMGISFSLSGNNNFVVVCKKALLLLMGGYALNVLKFILPAALHLMPAGLYAELQVGPDGNGYLHMLLLGDILHFAALALIILCFVRRLPCYPLVALLLGLVVCFIAPLLYGLHSSYIFLNYCLGLIGGQPPRVYFPLFPWLVYPLTGLSIGYYLKGSTRFVFVKLALTGCLLIVLSYYCRLDFLPCSATSFYRTCPPNTCCHMGIVLLWLAGWHWVSRCIRDNVCFGLLTCLSQNITWVYLIQWILIAWLLPVIGFRKLDLTSSILAATLICLCVLQLLILVTPSEKKHRHH